MTPTARRQLEAAARHIFAGREPCEYDFMRTVPSWHRTPPLPGRCRFHGLPVGKGRRTACSPECSQAQRRLAFWDAMCYAAWERDQHRCQECGQELVRRGTTYQGVEYEYPQGATYHHVIEVNEGGGQLGLDNIITLCKPCHAQKTAEYAARRADERRAQQRAESPQLAIEVTT